MTDEINVKFTKQEWMTIESVVRKQMTRESLNDLEDKKLRLKGLCSSYEREKSSLERDELVAKNFHSILDKIDQII
jgi:hypothetical protein